MRSARNKGFLLASLAGLLAATAHSAEAPLRVYGDELQRCIVALRPAANDAGAARVRHNVTGLEVHGLWREFTIESTLFAPGGDPLGQITSRCRTERWGPATELATLAREGNVGPARLLSRR